MIGIGERITITRVDDNFFVVRKGDRYITALTWDEALGVVCRDICSGMGPIAFKTTAEQKSDPLYANANGPTHWLDADLPKPRLLNSQVCKRGKK
jgi:hypothetical protein